jgi:hypothetical protein
MGCFFTDQYDLYNFIVSKKGTAVDKLNRSVLVATGEDFNQDIKDSCVAVFGHDSYDFAFDEVDLFFSLLQEKIGIQE